MLTWIMIGRTQVLNQDAPLSNQRKESPEKRFESQEDLKDRFSVQFRLPLRF